MNETDLYFTHTIVGAPQTVMLGVRVTLPSVSLHGVEVNLSQGQSRVNQAWQDWLALQQHHSVTGRPLPRPGRTRRWLLRHSLTLALLGLASLSAGLALLAWQLLPWQTWLRPYLGYA